MKEKNVKWLNKELPLLVENGVLDIETANKISNHYENSDNDNNSKTVFIVFAILGSVLISLGIILLLAKNWDEFPRIFKVMLSFLPLLIGQLLALWTITKKDRSTSWREGTGIFLTLSIGACISLIGQTYHVSSEFNNFVLAWMLLIIPVIYLLNSSAASLFYMIGITVWAISTNSQNGYPIFFWVLLLLVLFHVYNNLRKNRNNSSGVLQLWGLTTVLCIAIGVTLEKLLPGLWIIVYSGYFITLYFIGKLYFEDTKSFFENPFEIVGILGTIAISNVFTYVFAWQNIGWKNYHYKDNYHQLAGIFDYIICLAFVISGLYLLYKYIKKGNRFGIVYGVLPVFSIISYVLSVMFDPYWGVILFNIYLFGLGLMIIIKGINTCRIGVTNSGMIVIAILATQRFFDSDLSFIMRGIIFISIGIGFLVSNLILAKRKRGI